MASQGVRVTGYTPVYRGRGKKRVLVDVMERTVEKAKPVLLMDDKPVTIRMSGQKAAPVLLMDDKPVRIGVRVERQKSIAKAVTSWALKVGQFEVFAEDSEEDMPVMKESKKVAKKVVGAWKKRLTESAAEKHGSTEAWKAKSVKCYEEVLCDDKKRLEEELATLKARKDRMRVRVLDAEKERRHEELEAQRARLAEAEEAGDWGDMMMEEEALKALEEEIEAVWGV